MLLGDTRHVIVLQMLNGYQLSAKHCVKYSQLQNPSLLASEKVKEVIALC